MSSPTSAGARCPPVDARHRVFRENRLAVVEFQSRQPECPGEAIRRDFLGFDYLPSWRQRVVDALQHIPYQQSGVAGDVGSGPDRVEIGEIGMRDCMFPAGPAAPGEQQRCVHADCGVRNPPRRSHKSNMFRLLRRTVGVRDGSRGERLASSKSGPQFPSQPTFDSGRGDFAVGPIADYSCTATKDRYGLPIRSPCRHGRPTLQLLLGQVLWPP
jgi:hypothetical protein